MVRASGSRAAPLGPRRIEYEWSRPLGRSDPPGRPGPTFACALRMARISRSQRRILRFWRTIRQLVPHAAARRMRGRTRPAPCRSSGPARPGRPGRPDGTGSRPGPMRRVAHGPVYNVWCVSRRPESNLTRRSVSHEDYAIWGPNAGQPRPAPDPYPLLRPEVCGSGFYRLGAQSVRTVAHGPRALRVVRTSHAVASRGMNRPFHGQPWNGQAIPWPTGMNKPYRGLRGIKRPYHGLPWCGQAMLWYLCVRTSTSHHLGCESFAQPRPAPDPYPLLRPEVCGSGFCSQERG